MVVISKHLFYEKISPDVSCHIFHENLSCFRAPFEVISDALVPTFLFFVPIYFVKTLLEYYKRGKLEKNLFWKLLITQIRSSTYGYILACTVQINLCLMRYVFKRHLYCSPGFLGGFFSGLGLLVETKENRILDTIIFFNQVVESVLQNLNYFKYFSLTKTNQTLLFATVSGLLMYFLQRRKTKKLPFTHFWFYVPNQNNDEKKDNFWKLFKNYFAVGYLISLIKCFIPNMMKLFKKPLKLIWIVLNWKNVKFGFFISTYVLLYKWLLNKLKTKKYIPTDLKAMVAGFSAGLTYLISPNLQILVICITTLLQIIYSNMKCKLKLPNDNLYLQQLLFMLSNGYLLHNYLFCQETCPKFYVNMLNFCSNNRLTHLYKNLINKYFLN